MTHFEVESLHMNRKWWPIVMPGCGGVALQFATLEAAQSRYGSDPRYDLPRFRFVKVINGKRKIVA